MARVFAKWWWHCWHCLGRPVEEERETMVAQRDLGTNVLRFLGIDGDTRHEGVKQ